MGYPTKAKTWIVSPNNTVADATLPLMVGHFFKIIADFLLANGYTCKGSSNGTTAAMDGNNRWAAIADGSTRGANTTSAQSWMVLTDGNGCDICLSYTGGADTHARVAYSPGGLYVAAGTVTHTPTATDELALTASGGQSFIGAALVAVPRQLFGWVDSEAKMCRFLCSNNSNTAASLVWGVEVLDTSLQDRTIAPSVWGFAYDGSAGEFNSGQGSSSGVQGVFVQGTRGGRMRANGISIGVNGGALAFAGNPSLWQNVLTDLQGGAGYPMWGPFRVGGSTTNMSGIAGQLFDWWTARNANNSALAACGDTMDNKNFMLVGTPGSLAWPWDGLTTPVTGPQASKDIAGNSTGFENAEAPGYASFTAMQFTNTAEYIQGFLSKGDAMVIEVTQNIAVKVRFIMRAESTGLPLAGLSAVIATQICKANVTTFSTITPTITDLGNGHYEAALVSGDVNQLGDNPLRFSAPGALTNNDVKLKVIAMNKEDAVRAGLTALPNAIAGASGGLPLKSEIAGLVLNALLQDFAIAGSVADGVAVAAGLLQGNFMLDETTNTDDGQTAGRLRVWRSAGAMPADGGGAGSEGAFATFLVTTTYEGPGKITMHKAVRQ